MPGQRDPRRPDAPTPWSSIPPPRPRRLDPALVAQPSGFSVINSIFDNLVERDYSGALVPMLAESWCFPDPTTIEFKLRQGVAFHNGEPFNAASVKYSIERLLDPVPEFAPARRLAQDLPGRRGRRRLYRPLPLLRPRGHHLRRAWPRAPRCCRRRTTRPTPRTTWPAIPSAAGRYKLVEYARDDHTTLARQPELLGHGDVQRHAAGADRHLPTGARRRDAHLRPAQRHGRHDLRRLARRHQHAAQSVV